MSEIRFLDPTFTSELILRKESKALYQAARSEFERLRRIENLGIIAAVNRGTAYSRHHHLVGLLRIFERLRLQSDADGVPKKFVWSFWVRLCFGQCGHAHFAYDAERAVLLAARLNAKFRKRLRNVLAPVTSHLSSCSKCSHGCNTYETGAGEIWLNELIDQEQWQRLHLWVAARKLTNNKVLMSTLSGLEEFSAPEAFNMLLRQIAVGGESSNV